MLPDLWYQVFGNDREVEVEIGPERGTFLLAAAADHPVRNYVGIERSATRARRLEAALASTSLSNVRIVNADAACALARCVPAESVSAYHIYFPDPWWKHRHQRRRLLTPAFVAVLHRTLSPGGLVHLTTDVEETFALAVASFDSVGGFERTGEQPLRPRRTAFEEKALRNQRPLFTISLRKAR